MQYLFQQTNKVFIKGHLPLILRGVPRSGEGFNKNEQL
jgi:hypothetical protein